MSRARALIAGGLVATAYLMVAAVTFSIADLPVRPFFDGPHGAVPYRWIDPPPEEEPFNLPPQGGEGVVQLTARGSRDGDFRTLDLQAGVIFPPQAFEQEEGERRIQITITPVDPVGLAPPPTGQEFQGNAYAITARYARSKDPAPLAASECVPTAAVYTCASIILRTPFGAKDVVRHDGDDWVPLEAPTETGNDIFADTTSLGTFVALAPEGTIARAIEARNQVPRSGLPLRDVIAISLGTIATIAGTVIYRRRITARQREDLRKRAAGRKYKPAGKGKAARP